MIDFEKLIAQRKDKPLQELRDAMGRFEECQADWCQMHEQCGQVKCCLVRKYAQEGEQSA